MRLKSIELSGFKSFAKKTPLEFSSAITSIVGPNGSGKSNIAESFRFVLGEQSMKSMRGRRGEDLIWNGSQASPRAGRASVKLVFDNSDRALNLDFDEVMLERVVHRDGGNDYVLNGSIVRLRDIAELLSQANIGASGHHIISQGEADRVLSASSPERREMIEDALGLTAYLYKREEAGKKLEKTAENMREVAALRRELMPHLKFLQSQVKKIEESQKLQDDLATRYKEYLKRESIYLRVHLGLLRNERQEPEQEHQRLGATILHLREELGRTHGKDVGTRELMALEAKGRASAGRRDSLVRELGRIEGELAARTRFEHRSEKSIPLSEARTFAESLQHGLEEATALEGEPLMKKVKALTTAVREFIHRLVQQGEQGDRGIEELTQKKETLGKEMHALSQEEDAVRQATEVLRKKIENEKDASREAERELFQAMARRGELEAILAGLRARSEVLMRQEEQFKAELREAGVIVGAAVFDYEQVHIEETGQQVSDADIADEPRAVQEERRRKLERLRIRLEEIGAGNSQEVLKEYKETSERDQFLLRELGDLEVSTQKLHELIAELTKTLEVRFEQGIEKINKEFNTFFKLMFGGGSASLTLVKEKKLRKGSTLESPELRSNLGDEEDEVEIEEGIDIGITLPHKRIKGLHMLSGGERALTSIALIFAMSQVNPPPFLILDETDAALDEANSKRYGDMIESLAKKSQLILITHNRETMSRAGILYGVTMGSEGTSKLLSIKFEEALAVAK